MVETRSLVLPYIIKWLCWRTLYNIILWRYSSTPS